MAHTNSRAASTSSGVKFPTNDLETGTEARTEEDQASKVCLQAPTPLPNSLLWELQQAYCEALGDAAWSQEVVPSFISSNAKLARDYARMIFNFLRDMWGVGVRKKPAGPCLILEIGAGHGRFTYLLIKALLDYVPCFVSLGLPERPFLYVCTDVVDSNLETCRGMPDLQKAAKLGYLDFFKFDANAPPSLEELRALAQRHGWTAEAAGTAQIPVITICNYVLDSLMQEALQLRSNPPVVRRALLSIYSPNQEPSYHDPELTSRLSFGWDWEESQELLAAATTESAKAASAGRFEDGLVAVARQYLNSDGMSTVLVPVGGFKLVAALKKLAGEKFMLLVGDKGHQDPGEFAGWRVPHLVVHGSFSFMVNFDALRIYFEEHGGFSVHTPYLDIFQCGAYVFGEQSSYPSLLAGLIESRNDLGPASMIYWARQLSQVIDPTMHPQGTSGPADGLLLLKNILGLLRYSSHDPDLFWQFRSFILRQCPALRAHPRTVADLATDLDLIYDNYCIAGEGRTKDLALAIGDCLMRVGRPLDAIKYLRLSLSDFGPRADVLLQLAGCLQLGGRLSEARSALQEAKALDPLSVAAEQQLLQLDMCINCHGVAMVGSGETLLEHTGQLLLRDVRFQVRAVFAFGEDEARAVAAVVEEWQRSACKSGPDALPETHRKPPKVLWGADGLQEMLQSEDITVCVVDLPRQLLPGFLPKCWAAGKHVLSHSPMAYDEASARNLVTKYNDIHRAPDASPAAWHVSESARHEDALKVARASLAKLGVPMCISMVMHVSKPNRQVFQAKKGNDRVEERLAVELVRGLAVLSVVAQVRLSGISAQLAEPKGAGASNGITRSVALGGHFAMVADSCPSFGEKSPTPPDGVCIGTYVVCRTIPTEPSFELTIQCSGGSLLLTREKSAWHVTATTDYLDALGRKSVQRTVPCAGYKTSHKAFLDQIIQMKGGQAKLGAVNDDLADSSVMLSLVDTVIFESVMASMKCGGHTMSFKYNEEE